MSESTKKASRVVSKNQEWAHKRIQEWQAHVDQLYGLYDRILDDSRQPLSGGEFIQEMVGLGLNCWDTAYGWMFDTNK